MRWAASTLIIAIVVISICAVPVVRSFSATAPSSAVSSYLLVGGQNGTWFREGQSPRLERITLENDSVTSLTPVQGEGTVWSGGWNGSQWLISGWGEDEGPRGSNPYIYLYDGRSQILGDSVDQYYAESTWHGGDVFAASYDGRTWLLSGLGSGDLPAYGPNNHMSLSMFDGHTFTDLSNSIPDQKDAILYTNAWNGQYWLVGGGYDDDGVLFSYDGRNVVDLTNQIAQYVPTFGSVQSLAWNGSSWLIGGVGFLASYDGHTFTDLTDKLGSALALNNDCCSSVNAIAWNGVEWLLGGGTPIAQDDFGHFWIAKYALNRFRDLTPQFALSPADLATDSGILSITASGNSWVIGGYRQNHGVLYRYSENSFTNLSSLVGNFTYVNWVGAGTLKSTLESQTHTSTASSTPIQPEPYFLFQRSKDLSVRLEYVSARFFGTADAQRFELWDSFQ